jgi:hypothetical protein
MDQGVDKDSVCQTCGKNELVFAGPNTTEHVNTFLKMKQEAGGWQEWCQSENDKWRYIRDYHEKDGIFLDYKNIKNNHGLRKWFETNYYSQWFQEHVYRSTRMSR